MTQAFESIRGEPLSRTVQAAARAYRVARHLFDAADVFAFAAQKRASPSWRGRNPCNDAVISDVIAEHSRFRRLADEVQSDVKTRPAMVALDARRWDALSSIVRPEDLREAARHLIEIDECISAKTDEAVDEVLALKIARTPGGFQQRVQAWGMHCLGGEMFCNASERNFRFIEEAVGLVQSLGMTKDEVHEAVAYVLKRQKGKPEQAVGGVMTTLAALCAVNQISMFLAAETELSRINRPEVIARVRQRNRDKPRRSDGPAPLPQADDVAHEAASEVAAVASLLRKSLLPAGCAPNTPIALDLHQQANVPANLVSQAIDELEKAMLRTEKGGHGATALEKLATQLLVESANVSLDHTQDADIRQGERG